MSLDGLCCLVTGASRGLGLELVRQLREGGARVVATVRREEDEGSARGLGARVERLDVRHERDTEALAKRLGSGPIDVLFNNAGRLGASRRLAHLDLADVATTLDVNVMGPLRVARALLPALSRGRRKIIVNLSSEMGSLGTGSAQGYLGYRASKAALNMITRCLASELGPAGYLCVALSPGWVRTDMGGQGAPLAPEESVAGLLTVVGRLGPAHNGGYFDHRGRRIPW